MEDNKNNLFLTVVLTIFLVILISGVGYLFYQNQLLKNQAYQTSSPAPSVITPSPTAESTIPGDSYTENTTTPGQKKYVSPQLGISFLYSVIDVIDNKTEFTTKEMGNKVYIHPPGSSYETGQYIEVFKKDPNQTLEQAIKATFLENYSEEKCLVSVEQLSTIYPSSYTKARIEAVGYSNSTSMQEMSEKIKECPKIYTQSGGVAYFLMDENHPDKFVFFSIGNDTISSGTDDLTWQDTIEFLD